MSEASSIFENERVIGHGGMGIVHAATDRRTGRRVAVKRIHPRLFGRPLVLARFEREARAQSRIRSPFVVSVLDVGKDASGPYLAMELLEGESLEKRLGRDGSLGVEDLLRIGDELLAGAEAAHRAGVIHRDLSMANVFLARTSEGEHVKILDFGISKLEGQGGSLTGTGELFGTLEHLAPERFDKQPATNRSDLWSIAVVLYRCLGGTRPFAGKNEFQVIARIMDEPPDPLPAFVDERVREAFTPFFERAFQKKPEKRFASADEMRGALADVGEILRGTRPVVRVAPRPQERSKPPGPVAFVIALLAFAAVGAWTGTQSRGKDPPPELASFAVETDGDAVVTLDGLLVVDRARIPFPSHRGHVLRVSSPGYVARDVSLPERAGTRLRVRLAKAEPIAVPSPVASVPIDPATHDAPPSPRVVTRPHVHPPANPAPAPPSSARGLKPITRPPY